MKRTYITLLLAAVAMCTFAAAPNGSGAYYQNANGYKGAALKTELRKIIYNRTELDYNDLWGAFYTTDVREGGENKLWDMYSSHEPYLTLGTNQDSGSGGNVEGQYYNREHSFPQSWFGSKTNTPMYTDLHHIYPTDKCVNGKRANYPFGEVSNPTYSSEGGFSKLGPCSYSGYTGTVFEPNDMYKGDFARTYFYMVTCYEDQLSSWVTNYGGDTDVDEVLDGSKYPGLTTWQLNMLLKWAKNDPVSEKEINRNNAVYGKQNNRNPFIDYPGLEQYIWGSKKDVAFDYDDYDGSGSGDDPGPGPDPDPSLAGTYKLTITAADFNSTSYAANNNEKTSLAVCTTDDSKTYEVKWTSYQVMLQSGAMQWQKNTGYIYNSTDLGTITDVTITSSAGTFTTYYGTVERPSSSTNVGGGYFQTMVGNVTGMTSKLEITFTIGGTTPVLSSGWVETPLEDLTSSDIFVIVGTNSKGSYALPHNGGINSSPAVVAVTILDGKITSAVDNDIRWNVSGNASDGYIFCPIGSTTTWLYCGTTNSSGSNDKIRVGTANKRNKFVLDENGYLVTKDSYVARYLSIYVNNGTPQDWRGYINTSSGAVPITFYKYVAPPSAIPVTVSELGYGTFASDYALDFSASEIRAFYATESGNNLIFYEVEKVPANTGVLLYKVGGASDDIPVYSGTTDAVKGNAFVRGTGEPVSYSEDDKNYILFDGDDGLGFYKAKNNTVATNRAYIHVPVSVNVKCFLLDLENDPTGIESIQNSKFKIQNEDAIYNLAGQRLSKMQKGINIVNGKKVLR